MSELDNDSKEQVDKDRYIQALIGSVRPNEQQSKAEAKGLIKVYAYHCNRCNYLWFPRDYDYSFRSSPILEMDPPKSCARCKSRSWQRLPDYEGCLENSLARLEHWKE